MSNRYIVRQQIKDAKGTILGYEILYHGDNQAFSSDADANNDMTAANTIYNFLTQNQGDGPYGKEASIQQVMPGDVAQLSNEEGVFYHTVLITVVPAQPVPANVLVAAQSNDANCRPLDTYPYTGVRFIHIEGVRRCREDTELVPVPPNPQNPPSDVFPQTY